MPADKRIKIRRGTAAEWATAETSAAQLAAGEVAWVDNDLVKGDGTTKVASLPRAGTGTYAPFLGSSFVAIGDSITATGTAAVHNQHKDNWPTYLALLTGMRLVYNAGIGGDTSALMLARFDADVLSRPSDFVMIMAGTNDSLDGSSKPTATAAAIAAMVAKTRGAGRIPVLWTIPPAGTPASPTTAPVLLKIATINTWIRRFAHDQRIHLIDGYQAITDTTTGAWSAADMTTDSTHPTSKASRILGQYGAAQLSKLYAASAAPLCIHNSDPSSIIAHGCFLSMSGWVNYGGTGGSYTDTTPAEPGVVVGNWLQTVRTSPGDLRIHGERTIALGAGTAQVGDELEMAFAISTAGMDAAGALGMYSVSTKFDGPSTPNRLTMVEITADVAFGVWTGRAVVPSGCTGLTVQIVSNKSSGTPAYGPCRVGQIALRNLTRLGALL